MVAELSKKIWLLDSKPGEQPEPAHWCPGCKRLHVINVHKRNHSNAIWTWDGNAESPSFSPSVNCVGSCHYFLKGGELQFLGDSKHEFAGKTVPLPDIPEGEREWFRCLVS